MHTCTYYNCKGGFDCKLYESKKASFKTTKRIKNI